MRKLFHAPFLIAFFCATNSYAQECGTLPPDPHHYNFVRDVVSQIDVSALRNGGTTCVPLQAHVVRDGGGGGGVSMLDLNIGISFLNNMYLDAGLEFFWKGMPNYVNNADYFDFDGTAPDNDTESGLVALFTTATNATNIYFVNSITTASGFAASGYAYFPFNSVQSNRVVMRHASVATTPNGTFAHEFGHYFDLFHTHQGTENGNAYPSAENVPRVGPNANCGTDGDLLCDTEADPRYSNADFDFGTCTYTGAGTDINGVAYTPPVDNVMSYYPDACGGIFTNDQMTRAAQGLVIRQGHTAYNLNAPPQVVTDPSGMVAVWNGGQVDLSWTDNAGNETGYLIERSTTSAAAGFRAIAGGATGPNGTSYSDMSILPNTDYWYRVKASNDDCNDYSNVASVSVGLAYCTPTYFFDCVLDWEAFIDEFSFTGESQNISNVNTNCAGLTNYGDYTAMSADVLAGSSYSAIARALVGGGSYVPQYVQIYVDFDQNGSFEDAGEALLPIETPMGVTWSGMVTIPATALNGTTRMRVRSWDQANGCVATSCNQCVGGETEDYTLIISGGVSTDIKLSPKVFLEGPYNSGTGMMNDDLRLAGYVPTSEPFTALGYSFMNGGGETINANVLTPNGNNAIVDWVVVELRDKNNSAAVQYSRSALLQRDGDVVDLDGISAVAFNLGDDDYYVAIRHRNHLGAMALNTVSLSSTTYIIDFTLPATATYGTNAQTNISGTMCLWMGNTVFDDVIKYTGATNDRDAVLLSIGGTVPTNTILGYHEEDCNLDGTVKYTGSNNDRDPILVNIGGVVPTNVRMEQLP